MQLSLFTKLRELERLKMIQLESDPERHYFQGEGRYTYKGKPLEYLSDYSGPSPDGTSTRFKEPHDICWCPAENTVIASAISAYEPFRPLTERLKIRDPSKK